MRDEASPAPRRSVGGDGDGDWWGRAGRGDVWLAPITSRRRIRTTSLVSPLHFLTYSLRFASLECVAVSLVDPHSTPTSSSQLVFQLFFSSSSFLPCVSAPPSPALLPPWRPSSSSPPPRFVARFVSLSFASCFEPWSCGLVTVARSDRERSFG